MTTDFEFAVSLNTDEPLAANIIVDTLRDVQTLLTDIERHLVGVRPSEAEWKWGQENDLRVVAHVNGVDAETLGRVVGVAQSGFGTVAGAVELQRPIEWPREFGDDARRSAERILKRLALLESITIEATGHEPLVIREARLEEIVVGRSRRRVFSSVDGILELISHPRSGRNLRAGLRESHSGRYVKCSLDADRWRDELRERSLWDKRVSLYGRVAYDDEGEPLSIVDVNEIREPASRTDLRDFRGAAPDLIGGLTLDDAIGNLRDND